MSIRISNGFTGTPGIGKEFERVFRFDFDIEKCPYIKNISIVSFTNILGNSTIDTRVKERLRKIQVALREVYSHDVDPVQYLMYLYYKEGLGIRDVNKRLGDIGVAYKSVKSVGNLFVTTFGWELRDSQERTPVQMRKISNPKSAPIVAMKRHWEEKLKENINKFEKATEEILNKTHTVGRQFDREFFESLKGETKKAFYLLEVFEGISRKMIYDIGELSGIQASTTIAHVLNEKLQRIYENNPNIPLIKIGDASILNHMRKLKEAYTITPLPHSSSPS